MYEVKAIASFDHHGSRNVGDNFKVGSKRQAEELEKKGLAKIVGEPGGGETASPKSEAAEKPAPKKAAKKAAG